MSYDRLSQLCDFTPEERRRNLSIGLERRRARMKAKRWFGSGKISFSNVVRRAHAEREWDKPAIYGHLRVGELLLAKPGIGKAKAAKILEQTGIDPRRTVLSLGPNQVERLKKFL